MGSLHIGSRISGVEQLCKQIQGSRSRGESIDLSVAYFAFSRDVVKQSRFRYNEDLLGDSRRAAAPFEDRSAFIFNVYFDVYFD